jgi:hypothetical protein
MVILVCIADRNLVPVEYRYRTTVGTVVDTGMI